MSPPAFVELGKSASELFSKGFNYGSYKVDAKTKTKSGVKFTTSATSDHDSKKFDGSLETEYKWSEYDLTFNEKWTTDNTLTTEVTVKDQLIKGLKLSFQGEFVPQTGKKTGKILSEYKYKKYVNANLDVDSAGPTVTSAAVFGYKGWLAGLQLTFDTSKTAKSVLSQQEFAVGYSRDDLTLHGSVKDSTEFKGSVYHKVTKNVRAGVELGWTRGSNDTTFALAAKYYPDKDTTIRAKLNNATQLGLSYEQKIGDGATLTLSTLIEGRNFSQGGHKFGIGLDLDA